jgi:two-component system, response regulator, stage 0 sporulation protein F
MTNSILLVDDEETLRYVLRETLISEGYSVDVANNGFQALERVKLKSYDLLITDIKMHGMDGLQLIREVKGSRSHLKIVIITAYGSLEMVKEAARLGVIEFVSKPFKMQEIKDVIMRNLCSDNSSSEDDSSIKQFRVKNNRQLADNLLVPDGLHYYFAGPASQPKSTVVFDLVTINHNRTALIFGNVDGRNEKHREWWENKQIGVMIKTLFRSKVRNTPKKIVDNINTFLHKNIQPHIDMSILCALIDNKKQFIRYVNYGNSLVCSIFARDGRMEIMESFPYLLGIYPEIEISERSIPYSHGSKLVLLSSNTISKIMEKGALIKQMVENILQPVRSSHKKESKEIDLCSSLTREKEMNFDDETVLLVNLDRNHTTSSILDEKCK